MSDASRDNGTEQPARVRLPWSRSCFVCGEANPVGLRAEIFLVGDIVEMTFVPRREFAGWSEVVHGGIIGTVLDEVMTWAAIVGGRRAYFAADLGLRLKAPLAPETSTVARARVAGTRRQMLETEGWLEDAEGKLLARSTGRYLPVPEGHLARFRHDFVWGEDRLGLREVLGGRGAR